MQNPTEEIAQESPGTNGSAGQNGVQEIPTSLIRRSPFNREVDPKKLPPEFVESIRQRGIIQPLIVRPLAAKPPLAAPFELVAGERRWEGAKIVKLGTVPVIVRQLSDTEAIELQAIENLQRADLSPIEEAEKYQQLIGKYQAEDPKLTKEKAVQRVAAKVGKGAATIFQALRLLDLAPEVKEKISQGNLPPSHANLLAKLPADLQAVAAKAVAPGKELSPKEEDEIEDTLGFYAEQRSDTGLLSFRETQEMVDDLQRRAKDAQAYEKEAAAFRQKGGVALTPAEVMKDRGELVGPSDYLHEMQTYVREATKGVKELPAKIMRPSQQDAAKPQMVYRKSELLAALKKAGKKPRADTATRHTDYAAMERRRQAAQRTKKTILAKVVAPIRAMASKRNAKIAWPQLFAGLGWSVSALCKVRGWKCSYNDAEKVAAAQVAKLPENQMAGVVADFVIARASAPSALAELGKFYGVDVKAIVKEARKELAPPAPKKKVNLKARKPAVTDAKQRPGSQKAAKLQASGVAKRSKLLSVAGRKKLSALMKARWAARSRNAAAGKAGLSKAAAKK